MEKYYENIESSYLEKTGCLIKEYFVLIRNLKEAINNALN